MQDIAVSVMYLPGTIFSSKRQEITVDGKKFDPNTTKSVPPIEAPTLGRIDILLGFHSI
jgi:hypothetical protein